MGYYTKAGASVMQKKSAKLTVVSIIVLFILAPITIFLSFKFLDGKSYYIPAVLIIIFSMIPFFVFFEKIFKIYFVFMRKQNSEYLISEPYKSSNNEVKITFLLIFCLQS